MFEQGDNQISVTKKEKLLAAGFLLVLLALIVAGIMLYPRVKANTAEYQADREKARIEAIQQRAINASRPLYVKQTNLAMPQKSIIKIINDKKYIITPLAKYEANVMIGSKRRYRFIFGSDLMPYDMTFVWGRLAEPNFDRFMTYNQVYIGGVRRARVELSPNILKITTRDFVDSHYSNNHLIPANDNIYKAFKKIKAKQKDLFIAKG